MKRNLALACLLFLGTLFISNTLAIADADELDQLKSQMKEMQTQITNLEKQLQMVGHITPDKKTTGVFPSTEPVETGLVKTMEDIHMGGFVETSYFYNFQGMKTNRGANVSRVFDEDDNSFVVNQVELSLQKDAPDTGGAGFRVDVLMGDDAAQIHSASPAITVDEFDLQQAYIDLQLPVGNGLNVMAGKYVTLAGAEVIESKDNWNASRSLLFGFAIPFTHTGVRASYPITDNLEAVFGVNNGWDMAVDNNDFKTLEGKLGYSPIESLSLSAVTYFGGETALSDGHKRFLLDLLAIWEVTDQLSVLANADFGNERRVAGLEGFLFENAQWHGYAVGARYELSEKLAIPVRAEIFVDDDEFRITPAARKWYEITLGLDYEIYENMLWRLEFRQDFADNDIFGGASYQQTAGGELIYTF